MEKLIRLLQTHMEEPKPFGAFHLTALALVLLVTVLLCLFFRNAGPTTFRNVLITIWAIMFVMEGVRQIILSCNFTPEGTVWKYRWDAFPLQLCDSPLYILLPIALLKDGRIRDALIGYAFTYVLLGGIATYIAPSSIATHVVYLNVQTLAHHGLQIASCIYIGVYNRKKIGVKIFGMGIVELLIVLVIVGVLFGPRLLKLGPTFKKTGNALREGIDEEEARPQANAAASPRPVAAPKPAANASTAKAAAAPAAAAASQQQGAKR